MYSNRKQSSDYVTNALSSKAFKTEDFKLSHKRTFRKRRNLGKINRQTSGFQADDEKRFVFAYGDASISSYVQSFTPNPSKVYHIVCIRNLQK